MPVKNPKELFVLLLSHVRQSTDHAGAVFQQMGDVAQNAQIREALEARAFIAERSLATIDEVFKIIGEKPVKLEGRLEDVFLEDFRRELAEIQSPEAKRLFVLMKVSHLVHLHMGEYAALIAAADVTGKFGVGVLLESCLAEAAVMHERTRRLIRNIVESRTAAVGSVA